MIRPDIDELIRFLDSLAKLDPIAMGELVTHRVLCNGALGEHPTVQTGKPEGHKYSYEVGILGILNGYGGTIEEEGPHKGWGMIAAIVETDGRCVGFIRTDHQHVWSVKGPPRDPDPDQPCDFGCGLKWKDRRPA